MNVDEIRQIIDMMREYDLLEFELEQGDVKLRLRKAGNAGPSGAVPEGGPMTLPSAAAAAPAAAVAPPAAAPAIAPAFAAPAEDTDLLIVKSPIVGTFYRASEPGAPPFVDVGQQIRTGQVLCIIEAMKLMNEINAETDGEVVRIFVENGQPVQYGERLFAIRPA
jgi:acetyl-CoA carboxylase biotin carboxyl carrier protein